MNKKGFTSLEKIGIGSVIGLFGFVIMSFGVALNSVWLIRGGIVVVTFATWLISWK